MQNIETYSAAIMGSEVSLDCFVRNAITLVDYKSRVPRNLCTYCVTKENSNKSLTVVIATISIFLKKCNSEVQIYLYINKLLIKLGVEYK